MLPSSRAILGTGTGSSVTGGGGPLFSSTFTDTSSLHTSPFTSVLLPPKTSSSSTISNSSNSPKDKDNPLLHTSRPNGTGVQSRNGSHTLPPPMGSEDEVSSSGGEQEQHNNHYKFLETLHVNTLVNESVYESAAKLLFLSVKWARSVPSFLNVC